jgi:hypothetical protein
MEGIEISYGDSGYFRSLFLALSQGKEKLGVGSIAVLMASARGHSECWMNLATGF